VLNINNFYTPLLDWVDKAVEEGFISRENRQIVAEAKSVSEIEEIIKTYRAPSGRLNLGG
jgi:predicted Rossmann-fold nucleotide-binding protein